MPRVVTSHLMRLSYVDIPRSARVRHDTIPYLVTACYNTKQTCSLYRFDAGTTAPRSSAW
jgi:hypothetical protein